MQNKSRARKYIDEINPFKLGRENVRGMTIDNTMKKLEALKNEIDLMADDFVPEDDDAEANKMLKETSKMLAKAASNLSKVKGR